MPIETRPRLNLVLPNLLTVPRFVVLLGTLMKLKFSDSSALSLATTSVEEILLHLENKLPKLVLAASKPKFETQTPTRNPNQPQPPNRSTENNHGRDCSTTAAHQKKNNVTMICNLNPVVKTI